MPPKLKMPILQAGVKRLEIESLTEGTCGATRG